MKLSPVGSNTTEITLSDGTVILFSYKTPVAACYGDGRGFIRTSHKWSVTTSRHINKWLAGANAREVPQSVLDDLGDVD